MTLCFLGKISEEPGQHIFLPPVILRNEVTKNPVVGKPGSQNSFPCADGQRQRPLCRQKKLSPYFRTGTACFIQEMNTRATCS